MIQKKENNFYLTTIGGGVGGHGGTCRHIIGGGISGGH